MFSYNSLILLTNLRCLMVQLDQLIVQRHLSERVFSRIQIADSEIRDYYSGHLEEFHHNERVVIRQILFSGENVARKYRNQLTRENFGDFVSQYSIAPEKDAGGRLGPFSRGQMPEIFNVAFTMRQGDISNVLKSTYGFHIIILDRKLLGGVDTIETARPNILKILTEQKRQETYKAFIDQAMGLIAVSAPKTLW